ncbi:hypothetical protein AB0K48_01460 [Nonomuraea sp. NPDC055795]
MWLVLIGGLAICALIPALPSVGERASSLIRSNGMSPPRTSKPGLLVETTFYATLGIEVGERILPFDEQAQIRPKEVAPGVRVDEGGSLQGKPLRPGTFSSPIELCRGRTCAEDTITLIVYRNVPWEPRNLTFPGKVGEPMNGEISINGGPNGVLPTFTVTDYDKLPEGVSIGPDGHVGGTPAASGHFEIPVRICVAGNCAGVVVKMIVV